MRNGSLTGSDAKNDSLKGADIDERTLAQVPAASTAVTASNIAAPEAFHEVGAPGEPPFENGCTRYSVAGTPGIDGDVESPGFYRDREGRVHLKGMFTCPASTTIVFRLPPGYRPADKRILSLNGICITGCASGQRTGLIQVVGANTAANFDGALQGDGTVMSLDGVSFRAGG